MQSGSKAWSVMELADTVGLVENEFPAMAGLSLVAQLVVSPKLPTTEAVALTSVFPGTDPSPWDVGKDV
jgi:hypothetical protein